MYNLVCIEGKLLKGEFEENFQSTSQDSNSIQQFEYLTIIQDCWDIVSEFPRQEDKIVNFVSELILVGIQELDHLKLQLSNNAYKQPFV